DMFAKNIGQLSVLNVDKDVIQYGSDVAVRLHAMADSLRGVPIKVDELQNQMYFIHGGGWGRWWWGGGNLQTNIPQIELRQIEVIRRDEASRQRLWDEIDSARAATRSKMADRYKVDFNLPVRNP